MRLGMGLARRSPSPALAPALALALAPDLALALALALRRALAIVRTWSSVVLGALAGAEGACAAPEARATWLGG